MASPGRDYRREVHSPEERRPLTLEGNEDEQAVADQDVADPQPPPADKTDELPAAPSSGLNSIATAPVLPWHHTGDGLLEPLPGDVPIRSSFSHDDMEKMFETPRKFSVAELFQGSDVVTACTPDRLPSKPSLSEYYHVDESDYTSHRRVLYPHIHQPLRSMSSRSVKSSNKNIILKRKKKKKKKKKKKIRSYPSRNAAQSPPIPEEEEEESSDSTEDSDYYIDDIDDEAEELSVVSESISPQQPLTASPEPQSDVEVGFYIGSEAIDLEVKSKPTEVMPLISDSSDGRDMQRVPSVAAQKFKRSVSEEAFISPMCGTVSEDPQISNHAAFHVPSGDLSTPLLPKQGTPVLSKHGTPDGKVKFVVGGDSSYGHIEESIEPSNVCVPRENEVSSGTGTPPSQHDLKRISSSDSTRSNKSKHRHHHHHEHFNREDLNMRRQKGSEVHIKDVVQGTLGAEEEASLQTIFLEEMTSHRFVDVPGLRRPKIAKRKGALHSIVHIGKSHKEKRTRVKKKFDHSPHEMFVELDELHVGGDAELEWREKARWIKFEEDVEEGAERWGKPHVASLSFHSLLELRRGLEQGILLLDLEASDLHSIVNAVVEKLILNDLLHAEDQGKLMRTLLLKHKHQHEKSLRKTISQSSFGSSMGLNRDRSLSPVLNDEKKKDEKGKLEMVKVDVDNNMTDGVHIGIVPLEQQKKVVVQDIMRRIPPGSEASTVLVGQVDYMIRPALAFVRLSEGQFLENLTEVPLPVRFVFILLGPEKSGMDYHEVGRSISTLMSNQQFHDVAYQAENREEILQAINLFLNDSIVLPPGDWDQKTLLPIMDMARKRAQHRRRIKLKEKEKEGLLEKGSPDIPSDPLQRTGVIFGGLINDIKRRYPHYISDFRDAINVKCLMAMIFIFFACVSPCIAFGGLLDEKTEGWMGVSETLMSTAVCGMIFGLFCGQPLMIIGATGPILVFEQSLYKFAESNNIEFLPMRCWIGLWVAVVSTITVAAEGSFLVRYVTRFVEEIFAVLISIIFIYEVIKKLMQTFELHPLVYSYNCFINETFSSINNMSNISSLYSTLYPGTNSSETIYIGANKQEHNLYKDDKPMMQPNTALLSLILTLGTFLIAYFLRIFRNSKFLGRSVRRALGDFGVLIALLAMSLLDYLIQDTYTQKLSVQNSIQPTRPEKRGWFINPLGIEQKLPIWVIFASIIPAFLIFILLFMEVQITEMILNKKERKLKKGSGFHLDQFIMGILTFLCSLFGLPWMCAATVRTVAHVSSLSSYSKTHAPGEKPHLIGVKEQRLTNFGVHLLIGLSLLLGPVLRAIPMMALFGIFLYLGVSAMSNVQMFERMKLLLMPVKYHPQYGYVRRVRVTRMHLFTVIQVICLIFLLIIKSTEAALAFPFTLILLIPLRHKVINRIFTMQELEELDREEEDSEMEEEDDPDFYQIAHMPI